MPRWYYDKPLFSLLDVTTGESHLLLPSPSPEGALWFRLRVGKTLVQFKQRTPPSSLLRFCNMGASLRRVKVLNYLLITFDCPVIVHCVSIM